MQCAINYLLLDLYVMFIMFRSRQVRDAVCHGILVIRPIHNVYNVLFKIRQILYVLNPI